MAFWHLKHRFKVLTTLCDADPSKIPGIVGACVALLNVCTMQGDLAPPRTWQSFVEDREAADTVEWADRVKGVYRQMRAWPTNGHALSGIADADGRSPLRLFAAAKGGLLHLPLGPSESRREQIADILSTWAFLCCPPARGRSDDFAKPFFHKQASLHPRSGSPCCRIQFSSLHALIGLPLAFLLSARTLRIPFPPEKARSGTWTSPVGSLLRPEALAPSGDWIGFEMGLCRSRWMSMIVSKLELLCSCCAGMNT
ncbi:hypothetical protein BDK51DRAFT_36891 [Blyttiomyces helicus]|uniref:Uncharacterized protein n=1 Tax=Blyttiomyces helicus TaxID=388810 RepID=A0A4P9W2W3_9FUNG|nr:hypothetical protein BDK51DRAFT_36891 [Blyttiomyces helicus]|eukprot:RKO85148.1 hypothetical protein BDK51DRAFT_36891 [Blyttiomyces helicus]